MLSRVFNFIRGAIFGNPIQHNHEIDVQQHVFISRKRSSDDTGNGGSPTKRRCLDGGVSGHPFLSSIEDKESCPLRSLAQDSVYFTKPEMKKSFTFPRKSKAISSCRVPDYMSLKMPGNGFSSPRSANQGKENEIVIIDNEGDVEIQQVYVGTRSSKKRDDESCWVEGSPKYSPSSKTFQRADFRMKDRSTKDESLPPKRSDFTAEPATWQVREPSRGARGNIALKVKPKRLNCQRHPLFTLTPSSVRGIEETIRLDERSSYSQLLKQYEVEESRHPINMRSISHHPNKFAGVFNSPEVSDGSFTVKSKGKIELIDLTKRERERAPKLRRDHEAKPETATSKMTTTSTQIAVPLVQCTFPTINSFEDTIKFNKYYQPGFLEETLRTFNENKSQVQKELKEPLYRVEQYARNNEKNMKQIEERMMRHIKITDSEIVLDDVEEEEEDQFPALTPRMEKAIDCALIPHPSNETLVEAFSLKITRHDMYTLAKLNWLNDEVINFYMNLLIERGKMGTHPKVYAFNTFFYSKLVTSGHSMLKRWTRKIDIFSHDIIIVPVHLGMHWCMAAIDFRYKTIKYYDSMGNPNNKCLRALSKYLEDESLDKKKVPYDTSDWKLINVSDNPQQMNGSDCGVFACMYAEFICRDMKITFTQANMPYFRRKMVYEILFGKLLK